MKKAIIVGASSGIGKALAEELLRKNYTLAITARRTELLEEMKTSHSGILLARKMDVADTKNAREILLSLIEEMKGVDLVILNAGIGSNDRSWESEKRILETNGMGFIALANAAYYYFSKHGGGKIAGISSVAANRGFRISSVYFASKAMISTYMEGLRHHAAHKRNGVKIIDIRPGFIKTAMTENDNKTFWMIGADKSARLIIRAINRNKKIAYIPWRWAFISWIMRNLPGFIYYRT